MTRTELRNIYSGKLQAIAPGARERMADLMLIQFQQSEIEVPSLIMSYAPADDNAFNTQLITDYCYFINPGQVLFYPVVDIAAATLRCMAVTDDTVFEKNSLGMDEPVDGREMFAEEIDMVLVPLLAFDRRGYRAGPEPDYYGSFLQECRDDVVKVGFSFFDPVDRIADAVRHDVRLDYCITPDTVYRF